MRHYSFIPLYAKIFGRRCDAIDDIVNEPYNEYLPVYFPRKNSIYHEF